MPYYANVRIYLYESIRWINHYWFIAKCTKLLVIFAQEFTTHQTLAKKSKKLIYFFCPVRSNLIMAGRSGTIEFPSSKAVRFDHQSNELKKAFTILMKRYYITYILNRDLTLDVFARMRRSQNFQRCKMKKVTVSSVTVQQFGAKCTTLKYLVDSHIAQL